MQKMKPFIILAVIATAVVSKETFRYDNHLLYRIVPETNDAVVLLQTLEEKNENLNFWNSARSGQHLNVVAPPQEKDSLSKLLTDNGIGWKITIENIQSLIDNQTIYNNAARNQVNFNWLEYQTLDAIYNWLDYLGATHPNIVTVIKGGGRSTDNREIKGIKISHGPGRKGAFLEGGHHGREWISPAVVTYITNELLNSDFPETVAAAEYFDWYIFPVTNPDGYVYTHEVDRLWRKNRRPVGDAIGVDLNRNWNVYWNEYGTSSDPSQNTYPGNGPFSEYETRSLSAYISEIASTLDIYIAFHSSGQMFLLPYGHSMEHLENYWDTVTISRRAMGSLAVRYGTQYVVGNVAETIYMASGASLDWVKARFNVSFVGEYELRDRGTYGFLLPAEQIIPCGEETMDSLLAIIREGKFIGYFMK